MTKLILNLCKRQPIAKYKNFQIEYNDECVISVWGNISAQPNILTKTGNSLAIPTICCSWNKLKTNILFRLRKPLSVINFSLHSSVVYIVYEIKTSITQQMEIEVYIIMSKAEYIFVALKRMAHSENSEKRTKYSNLLSPW